MNQYALLFILWLGLGLLFSSANKHIVWGDTPKERSLVLVSLLFLCSIFGPFTSLVLTIQVAIEKAAGNRK